MTPNERKIIMDAVVALLKSVNTLGLPGGTEFRHMGIALQAALDADPAPTACDPYAKIGGFQPADPVQLAAAARPDFMPPGWIAGLPKAVVRDLTADRHDISVQWHEHVLPPTEMCIGPNYPDPSREKGMREINQATYRGDPGTPITPEFPETASESKFIFRIVSEDPK